MNRVSKTDTNTESMGGWGVTLFADGSARFRLWAPGQDAIAVRHRGQDIPMRQAGSGWFEVIVAEVAAGDGYMFLLPDGTAVPDPGSRAQAGDVHGLSLIVDPSHQWQNSRWRGRPWEEAVISEIHIGTFTPEGTFRAAAEKLRHLAEIGITAIEVMPVAQFAGNRGWGYDGVLHYAPHSAYGTPAGFKAFIDTAHGLGIMVLLDVVYNHFGPEGNYLHRYAPDFFHKDRKTPWGAAIDFGQEAVRHFFIENALYWIGEFRLDGLRFDAVEQIYDTSEKHLLSAMAEEVKAAFPDRQVHLVVEDQRNLVELLARDERGVPKAYEAEWNDDFHHVAHIIATGETIGHYKPFADQLWQKLELVLQHGFIYPDRTDPPELPVGERRYLPPTAFVDFLQNHDQIGNRAFGERLVSLTDPDMLNALTAILLLSPHTPFLFMGEEYGERRPFHFFTDYRGELAKIVREGRMAEAEGFGGLKAGKTAADLPDPNAISTFQHSKLDWQWRESDEAWKHRAFVAELLKLRKTYIVPMLKQSRRVESSGLEAPEGGVAVSWRFSHARLALRANLSQQPLVLPSAPGTVIYEVYGKVAKPSESRELPPRSVIFSIDIEAG
ncbi:malto-oligosyltrehalose trehalohydrolase [Rhizobium sp. BK650]|uniref:malto-oligosyltrehalose trehalohydrolase n=1 Tax=Rhizobium sp. BK650 TaxID=2586990 RepID=UPI00160C803C|nr:malto-oligosyltrehalose trehalohydrolase [Rhizobium sp. BK650]MBB3660930.1 malto-oligosyltrehalose trehalohydrolase [Rhizobium sp. BK650]